MTKTAGALVLVLAVAGLPGLAPDAVAKDRPDYVLSLDVKQAEVTLGDTIEFLVTLEKMEGRPVTANKLRLARNSVSLRVAFDDHERTITRIYGKLGAAPNGRGATVRDSEPPKITLDRDHPQTLELPLLAIRTGTLKFTALYTGLSGGPPILKSEPVEVKVKPDDGKTKIAAVMDTSEGRMVIELATGLTYNTTLNFLTLASEGRYDGLTFHRIIKGFMAQGGDPKGDGSGGPGWYIHREIDPKIPHVKGVISMARSQPPDSGGSQFFLMHDKNPGLDTQYAAFGRVVEGIEVIDKLCETPTSDGSKPVKPPVIRSVKVITR